jgi:hypothetical protein
MPTLKLKPNQAPLYNDINKGGAVDDPAWIQYFNDTNLYINQIDDISAANNTLYFSTTTRKLTYKDVQGYVHALY